MGGGPPSRMSAIRSNADRRRMANKVAEVPRGEVSAPSAQRASLSTRLHLTLSALIPLRQMGKGLEHIAADVEQIGRRQRRSHAARRSHGGQRWAVRLPTAGQVTQSEDQNATCVRNAIAWVTAPGVIEPPTPVAVGILFTSAWR